MIENSDEKSKVLLVDDELNVLRALTRLLRNYDITALTSAEEALLVVKAVKFDLVISDFRMPGMDGVTFLKNMLQTQPDAIRIILTGYADLESAQMAINEAGVYRFINKPWNNIEIINAVSAGLEHKRILLENSQLANQVREQQKMLNEKDALLNALEKEAPGITQVNWADDGSIIVNESDYE